ncbi:hypothetical protein EGI16_14255 [Chryseobacterium sp. G0240]|uniref:hypothetical protein n=1 Tax=Chryseobacterium sp. G0240 TaxID=2487066 RepID=UPI000F45ACDD|nr:hypothetical protein [Chryseobacterium sp. G0240]ROI02048.1 hypothetical protein EGI16_14255 [Chryseobacterium sp. G0240]
MKVTKKIKENVIKRLDLLKANDLFEDQNIDKREYKTDFYRCDNIDSDIKLYVSVKSPQLFVTNAAFLNNTVEIDLNNNGPVIIGTDKILKKQKLYIYSVATSIEDNITYTLNVTLQDGPKSKSYSVSLFLDKDETGEIIQQINFV